MQHSNLTIEDILHLLSDYQPKHNIKIFATDQKIINDLTWQFLLKIPLTINQSNLAIKIIKKYSSQLENKYQINVDSLLDNPVYKYGIRTIDRTKEIKIVDDKIIVKFNFDPKIIEQIRNYKSSKSHLDLIVWNPSMKVWEFPLIERHVVFLGENFLKYNFNADDEFYHLFLQCKSILEYPNKYIPYISYKNEPIVENLDIKIPETIKSDPLATIFHAKKLAIKSYDQSFYNYCEQSKLENYLTLLSTEKKNIRDINILSNIVRYNKVLFVLSQGNELNSIKFIKKIIDNSQIDIKFISTLTRLKSNFENGKKYNEFVKENLWNNPLNDQTKVVILSDKCPKPLLPYLNFDFIITLSLTITNNLLKSYMHDHPGIISYNIYGDDLL